MYRQLKFTVLLPPRLEMEIDSADNYLFFSDLYDINDPFDGVDYSNDLNEDIRIRRRECCSFFVSLSQPIGASLQLSVICGVMFGIFATFLWWFELNVEDYCFRTWDEIPYNVHVFRLLSDTIQDLIIMFWPLLTIAPICSWSMIKESNVLFWCAIAGCVDVTHRFFLFVFWQYLAPWKSYVGNVIFSIISFIVFYKFARHRQQQSSNNDSTVVVTFKLGIQLIVGIFIALLYNYCLLELYQQSAPLIRTIMSCSLIALLCFPKLIISTVITNLHGIYTPNEGITFAAAFLIITTMVIRLTQADIKSLAYFTIISVVHGIISVADKVTLPIRTKFFNAIYGRSSKVIDENWIYTQQYIAHQSLIGVITETSSIIMSNSAAYLLFYYYNEEIGSGKSFELRIVLPDLFTKLGIAILIEFIFNVVALKLQNDRYDIPVLSVWQREWKFILVVHFIQIVLVIVYFSYWVDKMLLVTRFHNSTTSCIGFFNVF